MTSRQPAAAASVRRDWSIRLGIVVILGFLVALFGPFGTYGNMSLVERLLYWGGLIIGALIPATLLRSWVRRHSTASALMTDFAASLLIALVIGPAVWIVNTFGMGFDMAHLSSPVAHVGIVWLICLLPVAIRHHLRHAGTGEMVPIAAPFSVRPTESPAFLRRLEADKRGTLWYVSADGHQLSVFTSDGKSRVRMRFSDALEELAAFDGVRVHRSHWVALPAIAAVSAQGRRRSMRLICGTHIPVSENGLDALRAVGFHVD